jgi:acyl-CoA thioesterase-1
MKKFIFSIISGIIILSCFIGCNNGTTDNGVSLVCLGDSLTAGYGATKPGEDDRTKSYPAYLQKKVTIPVVNAGKRGDTTEGALSRIHTDVLAENPRMVIVELGANDLSHGVPPETTQNNLQKIIDLINDGNRKIYIAKFYTEAVARSIANNRGITNYNIQTTLITQYDTMFEDLASSNTIELIDDIWDGVWGIHMSDIVHPDAAGYEIMAANYYKALEPYLLANNLLKQESLPKITRP